MNRYLRQLLPWAITDGGSYVLPSQGARRYRLAALTISGPMPTIGASPAILLDVLAGDGSLALRMASTGASIQEIGTEGHVTFSSIAVSTAGRVYLPPDLWVDPWDRVVLRSTIDWPGALTVVTCEIEDEA